jgi:hypothetical protein
LSKLAPKAVHHAAHGIAEIAQQVPAVSNLDGLRRALSCSFDVIVGPVPTDNFDLGMGT